MPRRLKHCGLILLIMAGLIVLGLASKRYAGPGAAWSRACLGGVVYVVFWSLAVYLMWPRLRPRSIAAGVLGVTCGLEFMQLWHPAWLQHLRSTWLGMALLGNSFSWWDLAHYCLAALLAWGLLLWLQSAGASKDPRTGS
ncbi:MAG: DUF2809 domain-containing protein [Desulfarculaceae bacterium]|nr:DUF2809 domain-containing protein [Desulfarculaceae bacterium]MCF8073484.1 DUF2809 domain-containing protein [Desulfarculaceae bacterium]MCF8100369.1 DUF2809 domain-containing protein [Desulfarculaceae bacterium]MCF8115895.1 DUF2809 domain-containing protein [Desulfarculaceae bacterium]